MNRLGLLFGTNTLEFTVHSKMAESFTISLKLQQLYIYYSILS